jgi:hypothetical protein
MAVTAPKIAPETSKQRNQREMAARRQFLASPARQDWEAQHITAHQRLLQRVKLIKRGEQ